MDEIFLLQEFRKEKFLLTHHSQNVINSFQVFDSGSVGNSPCTRLETTRLALNTFKMTLNK